MNDLEQRLARCFSVVFPGLDEPSIREATMSSVEAWDSIANVTLINLVEEEFGVAIDIEDMDQMTGFHQFLRYLMGVACGSSQ
jgi:acyl carrier protein